MGANVGCVLHGLLPVVASLCERIASGMWSMQSGELRLVVAFADEDGSPGAALLDKSLLLLAAHIPETRFVRLPISRRKTTIMANAWATVRVWDSVFAVKVGLITS